MKVKDSYLYGILYLNVIDFLGIRIMFETIFLIEMIVALLSGAFSVFRSILVEIVHNGSWRVFFTRAVKILHLLRIVNNYLV